MRHSHVEPPKAPLLPRVGKVPLLLLTISSGRVCYESRSLDRSIIVDIATHVIAVRWTME